MKLAPKLFLGYCAVALIFLAIDVVHFAFLDEFTKTTNNIASLRLALDKDLGKAMRCVNDIQAKV